MLEEVRKNPAHTIEEEQTEEKAKVVAAVRGTYLNAALANKQQG